MGRVGNPGKENGLYKVVIGSDCTAQVTGRLTKDTKGCLWVSVGKTEIQSPKL